MALALKADHLRKESKAGIRIAKSYVRYSTGSWVRRCPACAGARPIDEISDGVNVLAGMTAAVQLHSGAHRPSSRLVFNNRPASEKRHVV